MKLSKVGYPTGRALKIGRVSNLDDYPRWGYLDKFESNAIMPRAFCVAAALFLIGIGGWRIWTAARAWRLGHDVHELARGPTRQVRVLTAADLGVPPSLMQKQVSAIKVEVKTVPRVAMPIPVPDEQADEETIASTDEIALSHDSPTHLDLTASAHDSLIIDAVDVALPGPDEFVPFGKAPELIEVHSPRYPQVARDAGIEGTVLVRVLVGDDGLVKNLYVLESPPMLNQAAADAAWTAVFKPALQKNNPVAVWMVIPIVFKLQDASQTAS